MKQFRKLSLLIFTLFVHFHLMTYSLTHPILFLSFFVRKVEFWGKGTARAKLPDDAHFYTGPSKAERLERLAGLVFDNNQPCLSTNLLTTLNADEFPARTNAILSVDGEELVDGKWIRSRADVRVNPVVSEIDGLNLAMIRTVAPYGFNVLSVEDDGTIIINFPREDVPLAIAPFQTVCFLCRREEYKPASWGRSTPNLNLVLFVKNYGFHKTLTIKSDVALTALDTVTLCDEPFFIRDFRKSKLRFQLG